MRLKRDKRELTTRNQQMLALHREGTTLQAIAALFGVSVVRVHVIVHREAIRQQCELIHKMDVITP